MKLLNLKCEVCHKAMAVRTVVTLAGKRMRVCDKCYKLVKF